MVKWSNGQINAERRALLRSKRRRSAARQWQARWVSWSGSATGRKGVDKGDEVGAVDVAVRSEASSVRASDIGQRVDGGVGKEPRGLLSGRSVLTACRERVDERDKVRSVDDAVWQEARFTTASQVGHRVDGGIADGE